MSCMEVNTAAPEQMGERGAAGRGSSAAGLGLITTESRTGAAAAGARGKERPTGHGRHRARHRALHRGEHQAAPPTAAGPCLYEFMSYETPSLWKFPLFFFLSEPHKIAFCSIEINWVYVRETFRATVGFASNPVSCCLMLLWLSLVYFLSSKWRI